MKTKLLLPIGAKIKATLIALMALTLAACGDEESKKMPEDVAQEFVEAIYNSKDINAIKKNSVKRVAGLVDHYRSIKMIQRNLMELSLDSATVQVTDVGGDFFRKSKKDTRVELHIRGKYQGGVVADDRFLTMTWENNRWKVKKISKS
ncbi:MAG: hypothetical protein ACPGR2_13970 [Psychrobium sp.]